MFSNGVDNADLRTPLLADHNQSLNAENEDASELKQNSDSLNLFKKLGITEISKNGGFSTPFQRGFLSRVIYYLTFDETLLFLCTAKWCSQLLKKTWPSQQLIKHVDSIMQNQQIEDAVAWSRTFNLTFRFASAYERKWNNVSKPYTLGGCSIVAISERNIFTEDCKDIEGIKNNVTIAREITDRVIVQAFNFKKQETERTLKKSTKVLCLGTTLWALVGTCFYPACAGIPSYSNFSPCDAFCTPPIKIGTFSLGGCTTANAIGYFTARNMPERCATATCIGITHYDVNIEILDTVAYTLNEVQKCCNTWRKHLFFSENSQSDEKQEAPTSIKSFA